jgi:hypothetical protein
MADDEPLDAVLRRLRTGVQFQPWDAEQHNKQKQQMRRQDQGPVLDGSAVALSAAPAEAAAGAAVPELLSSSSGLKTGRTAEWKMERAPVELQCRWTGEGEGRAPMELQCVWRSGVIPGENKTGDGERRATWRRRVMASMHV